MYQITNKCIYNIGKKIQIQIIGAIDGTNRRAQIDVV